MDFFKIMENINYVSMPCGGKGICGKCKIKIVKGNLNPNFRDRKFLSPDEIKKGYRIACGHNIGDDVEFTSAEETFDAVSGYFTNDLDKKVNFYGNIEEIDKGLAVIIDVGTTTLCFELLSKDGARINTVTMTNSQRAFGADVISRISKAMAGGFSHLRGMLKGDLRKGISILCKDFSDFYVSSIFIAGNTTMTYFLRDMDIKGLGVYPFENNAKDIARYDAFTFFDREMPFGIDDRTKIMIMPCIHAFVGGDIVSGAYFLDFDKKEDCLFIDIGTNGEMILNSGGKLYCASAAAGPAFEGGGVSCGSGGVLGAINSIKYKNGSFKYTTIGNKTPVGICGSALIDLTAELLENKIIDEAGLLREEYFSKGVKIAEGIFFNQKDIREIQLAKSAIASGVECILNYGGKKFSDIKKVFIGGGFGFYLNPESVFKIKMLPHCFYDKIEFCGNTVLGGLLKAYVTASDDYEKFVLLTRAVNLAEGEEFQKVFIENLNF